MMRLTCLLCIIVIISCFALFDVTLVSDIYNQAGMLIGFSSGWAKTQAMSISNIGHIVAYCILFSFISIVYRLGVVVSFGLVFGIACTLEVLQVLTPGRQFSFADITYNLTGIGVGCAILLLWRTRYPHRQEVLLGNSNDK